MGSSRLSSRVVIDATARHHVVMDGTVVGGLVGVVAGAVATVLAGYLGPLKVQRRQAELAFAMQQHQERQEALRRREARQEQRVSRIANLRHVGREWIDYLEVNLRRLEALEVVDLSTFDETVARLKKEAHLAASEMMVDGVWISSGNTTGRSSPSVLTYLASATNEIRSAIVARGAVNLNSGVPRSVYDSLDRAALSRSQLHDYLLSLISNRFPQI